MSKIIETTNGILQNFSGSASEREKLESFKVTSKDKKEVLKNIDETVLESTKEEDINKEIIEASEVGESINRICVRINYALNPVNNVSSPSTESVASSNPTSNYPKCQGKATKANIEKILRRPKIMAAILGQF